MQGDHTKNDRLQDILTTVNDSTLAEALMVRLAYKFGLNMFGKQINDRISTIPHAKSIQVHPYPWFAAGSAAVLVQENKGLHISVVLIKEKKNLNVWHIPGGYAFAAPLLGGEDGFDLIDHQTKDEAEEEILKGNVHAYEQVAAKYNIDYSNPNWKTPRIWDNDLTDCMRRELYEEVGVKTDVLFELISHEVQYEKTTKIHTIVNTYLINVKTANIILKPDNFEVEEAVWAPLNKIQRDPISGQFSYEGLIIPLDVATKINEAVRKARSNHFILGSKETFLKLAEVLKKPVLQQQPFWEFGADADVMHQQLIVLEEELLTKLRNKI
jgi:ADP-ribose pyrophosphatase YjhB (NUDIX family)